MAVDGALEKAGARSRLTAWLTLISAAFILTGFVYVSWRVMRLSEEVERKQQEIRALQGKLDRLKSTVNRTESYLLDFLGEVTSREQVRLVDPSVDWEYVEKQIVTMSTGERKRAVIVALLYAWKDIPFTLGGRSLVVGMDSPQFLRRVLSHAGVTFELVRGEPLSAAIMRQLQREDAPQPGDLAFYHGQVGSFGFLILTRPLGGGAAVGVGTLQKSAPLQVIRLDHVNTADFPLIGYFHVKYPGDQ